MNILMPGHGYDFVIPAQMCDMPGTPELHAALRSARFERLAYYSRHANGLRLSRTCLQITMVESKLFCSSILPSPQLTSTYGL